MGTDMDSKPYGSLKRYPLCLVPERIVDHRTYKNRKNLNSCSEGKHVKKKAIDDLMNSGDTAKDAVETEDAEKGIFSSIFVFNIFNLQG